MHVSARRNRQSAPGLIAGAALVITILFLTLAPAQAQSARTYVARGSGSDANNCLFETPCLSFQRAHDQTIAGGEINVLEIGNYSSFTISKAITVDATGAYGTVTPFGAGITINAGASDVIVLRNIEITGSNLGSTGIQVNSVGALHVDQLRIRGLQGGSASGIVFAPSSGASELYVTDTHVTDNAAGGATGILIRPTGSASVKARLENVVVENHYVGVSVDGSTSSGSVAVAIDGSSISGNNVHGVHAFDPSGGGSTVVSIEHSRIANNGSRGILSNGTAASVVFVGNSAVTGNHRGVERIGAAQVISTGGNVLVGNNSNGVFSGTVARQ